uniref:Putative nucleoside-diphosphate sugar epimerase n=1 Tax=Aedes albopictus TaxID=7160 RepID=A0A023EMV2_AEDAL|nr:epimerase family protein SDR39U1-like [Aedes albopictus]XP_019555604.2 epimerase family protein SDR39U1 [Aedes albopictus]XP_029719429.1 epimerase family protein SDR39U1-like [Aedes albopictus]
MALKHVVIGGGTGFIGKRLAQILRSDGYDVTTISRMPAVKHMTWHDLEKDGLPTGTSAVVNLAGQNVLDPTRRWTPGFKQNVWNSRINTTAACARAIEKATVKPRVFVSICGVSHYAPGPQLHTEESKTVEFDFMSRLCIEWEKAANLSDNSICRVVKLRSGVVIGREGGMIQSLILPFWLGLGGPIGDGSHDLPWIHVQDVCNMIKFAIEKPDVSGVLNGVAPELITNRDFTKAFASALIRPAIFPLPEFVLNLIFDKERAALLTNGAKVVPKRPQEFGYKYQFPDIRSACKDVARLFP